MINLGSLVPIVGRSKKRVGRGYGSGKGGHTVGRGQKGQKTRAKIKPLFEGTKTKKSLIQRLPLLRGRGKFKPKVKPFTLTLGQLEAFRVGSRVDLELLIAKGVVPAKAKKVGVKLLGSGALKKRLSVGLPTTRGAASKIQAAGGTVEK